MGPRDVTYLHPFLFFGILVAPAQLICSCLKLKEVTMVIFKWHPICAVSCYIRSCNYCSHSYPFTMFEGACDLWYKFHGIIASGKVLIWVASDCLEIIPWGGTVFYGEGILYGVIINGTRETTFSRTRPLPSAALLILETNSLHAVCVGISS